MEAKWAVLKNRKTAQDAECMVKANNTVASKESCLKSSFNKLGKRNRLVCTTDCLPGSWSTPRDYTNFSKSGLPERVLYHHDGQWIDYPQDIVKLVREHFQSKNAAIELSFDGCHFLLDALYMIQIELQTGVQKKIAWIDEAGCCFFPEFHSTGNEICECHKSHSDDDSPGVVSVPNGTTKIELQLEVDLNGVCNSKFDEIVEESNVHAKKPKILGEPVSLEVCDTRDQNPIEKMHGTTAGDQWINVHSISVDSVRNMFVTGMSPFKGVDIFEIKPCSIPFIQTRLQLFQKQVELTKKIRGDPNVQYAWLPVTKDALSNIMVYGLEHSGHKIKSPFGLGVAVQLTPVDYPCLSARYCDDDENGLRYYFFCRVLLGKVEVVKPGQWQPTSENFDNGVDNLRHPCQYVVWNMNLNTHIFPEYVISFKMSSSAEGAIVGSGIISVPGNIISQGPQGQLQLDCHPVESISTSQEVAKIPDSGTQENPRIPLMSFPMLLDALSEFVAPKEYRLMFIYFDLFRRQMLSRDDFIKSLRSIVGDTLLRSTITRLQNQVQRARHEQQAQEAESSSSCCTFKIAK
ncbi:RST domain-containing protein [Cephalotus follicularis]|uniref:RST domain-containing protein n=1 Tax=Cephalotus follicularis TaxID=3775 RepID=A0A1Q3API4_CEPFO|nr:RST domain-containing protein [Cephalotus follicularis]